MDVLGAIKSVNYYKIISLRLIFCRSYPHNILMGITLIGMQVWINEVDTYCNKMYSRNLSLGLIDCYIVQQSLSWVNQCVIYYTTTRTLNPQVSYSRHSLFLTTKHSWDNFLNISSIVILWKELFTQTQNSPFDIWNCVLTAYMWFVMYDIHACALV